MHFNRLNGLLDGIAQATEPTPMTALEEKQAMLAHMVKLVARKMSNGLFVAGTGGVGKSRVITETLAAEGIQPVLLNSHVTPLSLYTTLFHHRKDAVLWLDDADSIFPNMAILGLLRSALWGQGERTVTYTSSQLQGVPASFTFDSRIIFCSNVIPRRNEAFRAMLSRVDVYEITATNAEIIEQMKAWAAKGFGTLSPGRCLDVVAFIEKAGGSRQLSLRLYEPSMRKVIYADAEGIDWRDLIRSQLDQIGTGDNVPQPLDTKAHDLKVMAQAVAAYPSSVRLQEEFWRKGTGKSRASFFRTKAEYQSAKEDKS